MVKQSFDTTTEHRYSHMSRRSWRLEQLWRSQELSVTSEVGETQRNWDQDPRKVSFKDLFKKSADIACKAPAFFHGLVSLGVDGTQMTLPDTPQNAVRFGKPGVSRGVAAFPQIRVVGLVITALQSVQDLAFGPCWGKGTGERTLARELILRHAKAGLLFLLDRGFFGFELLHSILTSGAHFIVRVPKSVKLTPIRNSRQADGSYLAWIEGKIEDPTATGKNGHKDRKSTRSELQSQSNLVCRLLL